MYNIVIHSPGQRFMIPSTTLAIYRLNQPVFLRLRDKYIYQLGVQFLNFSGFQDAV